jgi:hypothetical protein
MAKALVGHVGGPDVRTLQQLRLLQQRVRDLESELQRVTSLNEELAAELHTRDLDLTVVETEPALT